MGSFSRDDQTSAESAKQQAWLHTRLVFASRELNIVRLTEEKRSESFTRIVGSGVRFMDWLN